MINNLSVVIDFDDTLVEQNTASAILNKYVPIEYNLISKLYRSKKINFRDYQERSFNQALTVTNEKNLAEDQNNFNEEHFNNLGEKDLFSHE